MVTRQAQYILLCLRQAVLNFPTRYARHVVGIEDEHQAKAVLTKAAHEFLTELADFPNKAIDPGWMRTLEQNGEDQPAGQPKANARPATGAEINAEQKRRRFGGRRRQRRCENCAPKAEIIGIIPFPDDIPAGANSGQLFLAQQTSASGVFRSASVPAASEFGGRIDVDPTTAGPSTSHYHQLPSRRSFGEGDITINQVLRARPATLHPTTPGFATIAKDGNLAPAEVMSSSNPPHTTHVRALLRGWAKRYGASEIAGALAAYIGYFTVLGMTQNPIASAYGGSIGESLAFFGVLIVRRIAADQARAGRRLTIYGPKQLSATIHGLFVEFGPAELLDVALIGPLAIGVASYHVGPAFGILLGKLASDVVFYGFAIVASEMRGRRARAKIRSRLSSRLRNPGPEELNDVVDTLAKSEAFGTVPHEDLEFLATLFEHRYFADAEVICHRGDEANEFYVIKNGQVEVKADFDGPAFATLGRSAVIGEYGIFTGSKRTATLIANGSVRLLALDYDHFRRFMLAFPEATVALFKAAVLRQVQAQQRRQSED